MTIISTPRRRASSTSAAAVMPQSTVRISFTPSSASRAIVTAETPYPSSNLLGRCQIDVGAELAQRQHRERRRADAVDVVVAVDADPLAALGGRAQPLDGRRHVAEEERVVADALGLEERPAAAGSSSPRRTSTVASVSETPSAAVSSRTSGNETGSTFQLPAMQSRVGPGPDGSHGDG